MSDIFKERHAKLGCIVLKLFPKVMQKILKEYITPKGLQKRFSKNDFRLVFTENEVVLMENLPNIDDFTIEISYKLLRFEFNMLDEPKCKWGNVPHNTEIEIADDIQRLINATNSISKINTEEVTAQYSEKMLEEIKCMVTRIGSYLEQDDLRTLYTSLCRSETDSSSILQDLTRVKAIEESLPDTESENRERCSRVSMAIIEAFTNILRDVIQSTISASQLYQKCIPIRRTFYAEDQKNLTTLQHSNSYDSLDITLIYQLLRQFSLIPSPTKGWGSIPDKVDIKVGDDIERIRFYRNQMAHRRDIKINKTEFDEYFEKFRDIGHRIDLYFNQQSSYEQRIIGHKTCRMDTEMQAKYENAMKEMENIKLKCEKKPIKVYWGDSFNSCLMNLRSLLKDEKLEGRQKVRVQIIFQNEEDVESNIEVLNSLTEEINKGLSGIELIIATKGSIVLHVDILLGVFETDEKLQTTLALFLEKILERITAFTTETIDIVLLHAEENTECNKSQPMGEQVYLEFDKEAQLTENTECNKSQPMGEQVYLEFDIEAQLLETDDKMVEQLRIISDAIFNHSNPIGTNQNSTATLLHIDLDKGEAYDQALPIEDKGEAYDQALPLEEKDEAYDQALTSEENTATTEESFTQAQTPAKYNLPVSVTLRQQLYIKKSSNEKLYISSCIKIDNTLLFTDKNNDRLIICNSDGTDIHHIPLSYKPDYMTVVNSNTVAVSCREDRTILIINISTGSVTSTIKTGGPCYGISYNDNNLYVDNDGSVIRVMDLTGKVIRTIPLPSYGTIHDITVDRDRLICIAYTSIYCCSLDGKLIWKFKQDKIQDLRGVTTDDEGNIYVTTYKTDTVVVTSDDGKHHRELLTKSDGLNEPWGIYFDKIENILLVCNVRDGKAFLFDVKKKLA